MKWPSSLSSHVVPFWESTIVRGVCCKMTTISHAGPPPLHPLQKERTSSKQKSTAKAKLLKTNTFGHHSGAPCVVLPDHYFAVHHFARGSVCWGGQTACD